MCNAYYFRDIETPSPKRREGDAMPQILVRYVKSLRMIKYQCCSTMLFDEHLMVAQETLIKSLCY